MRSELLFIFVGSFVEHVCSNVIISSNGIQNIDNTFVVSLFFSGTTTKKVGEINTFQRIHKSFFPLHFFGLETFFSNNGDKFIKSNDEMNMSERCSSSDNNAKKRGILDYTSYLWLLFDIFMAKYVPLEFL